MSLILNSSIKKARFTRLSSRAAQASLLAVAFAGAGLCAQQAYAATDTANGTATVMTPIAISKTADLRFGKFSALTGGTVVISTAGARSVTGAVVPSATDVGGEGSFSVTGDANATYAITLPGSATITHTVDNTKTMSIGTFISNPSGTGTLSGAGTQTLSVGGTLTVGNAQTVGSYTGTFDVTVEYN
jgi:spore coat protein U-like protein